MSNTPKVAMRYQRIIAHVIDNVFNYVVALIGGGTGGLIAQLIVQTRSFTPEAVTNAVQSGRILGAVFWGVAAWAINSVFLQGMTGSSLGKSALHLRVVNLDGQNPGFAKMFGRSVVLVLMNTPYLVLGHLVILFTKNRQGLHDLICKTLVIEQEKAEIAFLNPPQSQDPSAQQKAA